MSLSRFERWTDTRLGFWFFVLPVCTFISAVVVFGTWIGFYTLVNAQ